MKVRAFDGGPKSRAQLWLGKVELLRIKVRNFFSGGGGQVPHFLSNWENCPGGATMGRFPIPLLVITLHFVNIKIE